MAVSLQRLFRPSTTRSARFQDGVCQCDSGEPYREAFSEEPEPWGREIPYLREPVTKRRREGGPSSPTRAAERVARRWVFVPGAAPAQPNPAAKPLARKEVRTPRSNFQVWQEGKPRKRETPAVMNI